MVLLWLSISLKCIIVIMELYLVEHKHDPEVRLLLQEDMANKPPPTPPLGGSTVESLQRHWAQTCEKRQGEPSSTDVAPALRPYQNSTLWPVSGTPLPVDLQAAVSSPGKEGSSGNPTPWYRAAIGCVVVTILLSVVVSIIIGGIAFPGLIPIIGVILCACKGGSEAKKTPEQHVKQHVEALHLLYLAENLSKTKPIGDPNEVKFLTTPPPGNTTYKVMANGQVVDNAAMTQTAAQQHVQQHVKPPVGVSPEHVKLPPKDAPERYNMV